MGLSLWGCPHSGRYDMFQKHCWLAIVLFWLLPACERTLGYGVVLWSPEDSIPNGLIVGVQAESKVYNTYTFVFEGQEYTVGRDCVIFFRNFNQAQTYREKFYPYRNYYVVNRNLKGLIIRSEPNILSSQVYKLSFNQWAKVLHHLPEKMTFKGWTKPLEGTWYEVLTEDGVQGFVFDYFLRVLYLEDGTEKVFKESEEDLLADSSYTVALEELEDHWYTESQTSRFRMDRALDLRVFDQYEGNFSVDLKERVIRFSDDEVRWVKSYTEIDDSVEGVISFVGTDVEVLAKKENAIELRFDDPSGKREYLKRLEKISEEEFTLYRQRAKERHLSGLSKLLQYGNQFLSALGYGYIRVEPDGRFYWSDPSILIETGVLPAEGENTGSIYFPYFLGDNLRGRYDDIVVFDFKNGPEIIFLTVFEAPQRSRFRLVSERSISREGLLNTDIFITRLNIPFEVSGAVLKAFLP